MRNKKVALKLVSCASAFCLVLGSVIIPGAKAEDTYSAHYTKALELQQQYVSAATGAPVFGELTHDASVGAYDKLEIKIDLEAEYTNPFDPDDITVNGVFTTPSGEKMLIPAFYTVPMESKSGKTLMTYSASAYQAVAGEEAGWRVRFSGKEIGQYSFYIEVRDSQGRTAVSDTSTFSVTPSDNSGYVVVSSTNPEYFETAADNRLFYGSGANIAWVRTPFTTDPAHLSYDYFLKRAWEEGTNMTRVWMCHWAWLEWMPDGEDTGTSTYSYAGLGYYNQDISAAMDRIMEMCEEYDLKVVLTLDDNNEHLNDGAYGGWAYNPYNIANGGPATDTTEYWANEEVREYYKKRLRYIVARWGYSSSLFSINLWNDCTATKDLNVVEYLQELYDYKNSITENFRPLLMGSNFNHYTGTETDENGEVYSIDAIFDYTTQHLNMKSYNKPSLTQECFSSSIEDNKYFKDSLHDTVWSEFMRKSGSTMIWSHDTVDETGSYDTLANVTKFAQGLDLNKQKYTYNVTDGVVTAENISLTNDPYKIVEATPLGDASAWLVKATENEFYFDYNDSNKYLAGYNSQLYGNNASRKEYRNPPTFYVNAPAGGKMIFYVGSRGSGTNILTATINGEVKELGRWSGQSNDQIGYISIDLAEGDNVVHLDNTGNDWISVGRIYVVFNADKEQDVVKVSTLRSENQSIVYAYNTTYNYLYNTLVGFDKEAVSDINIRLGGFKNAMYEVKMYNPTTGRYLTTESVKVDEGKLNVSLPAYSGTDMPISFKMNALASEDKAVAFKIDTTGVGSDLSIRGCLSGDGYRNTGGGKSYYLIDENGNATSYKFAGERLTVPQNFVGTLVIPMEAFAGNGNMDPATAYTLDTLSVSFYIFDTTAETNNLVLGTVEYMDDGLNVTNTALKFTNWDEIKASRAVGTWGALNLDDDFNISDYELSINIPYLEHDMIFSITEKDQYKVEFLDPSGRVHETLYVKSGSVIDSDDIPALPARTGYTVNGWSSQVNTVISDDTVIRAIYEKDANYQFEVTSTNGTVQYPGNKTYANFEDLIRVNAPAEENGVPFSHWEIDGVKVSEANPYAFRASGSVCLTAVYAESAVNQPGVFLNNSAILTQVTDTTFKFSMIGQSYIPDGYTLVEAGILLAAGDKSNDSLTIADKIRDGRFSIVGNASADDFIVGNHYLSAYKPAGLASTESFGWQLEITSPAGTDEAVSLYVDATAVSGDFSVVPFFKSGDNTMTITPNTYVYLCYENGNTATVLVGADSNVPVPAGFVGEVVVPFSTLASTPQFDASAFPLYSNLIFGITFKGLADGEHIGFKDLIFREINDGQDTSAIAKQSPFFGYYEDVYQNFSDATADTLGSYASTWTYGGYLPTIGLTEDKRLSLTGSSTTNVFVSVKGTATLKESTTGISIYIDMSSQKSSKSYRLTFSGKLDDGTVASFYPWYGGKYYLIDSADNTVVEKILGGTDQWSTWISIPAGFVGKMFIPLETFIAPDEQIGVADSSYTHHTDELIGKAITGMNFQWNLAANTGDLIYADDFCLLYDTSGEFSQSALNSNWVQNMAQNFDNATAETLSQFASVNSGSTLEVTDDGRVTGSRADSSAMYLTMYPNTTFSKDATGVSFHYDASGLIPTYNADGTVASRIFRIYMQTKLNGVTYNFMPWYGKPYYFLPDGEGAELVQKKVSGSSQWNSWLNVTPGVSGTYYIPFESMTPPDSLLESSNVNIDDMFLQDYHDLVGQNINYVEIMQSSLNGGSITVDNLCWIYESIFTAGKTEERFHSDMYIGSDKYKTVKIPVMSAYDNSQFMVSLTNISMENIRSGRGYIIVRDKDNNLATYYSDSVCVASWLKY